MASAFQVYCSKAIAETIQRLYLEHPKAVRQEVIAAFHAIEAGLRSDPVGFGESAFRLPLHGHQVYFAVQAPLMVTFAVDERKKMVFLHSVRLLDEKPA